MPGKHTFSRVELAKLRTRAAAGEAIVCPRCELPLLRHAVPRPPEVSYVRNRTWWLCPRCERSAVLDE